MKAPTSHEIRQQIAVGYIRVSTHEQAQEGVSLDAQRDKLRSYCKGMGIKLVEVFADEDSSGGERPGLQDSLRVLQCRWANTLVAAAAPAAASATLVAASALTRRIFRSGRLASLLEFIAIALLVHSRSRCAFFPRRRFLV